MKTGVLLINLGTPDSPSTGNVRKYLTEFLNDRRVIDISAFGRFVLVNGIIVPFRSSKSAKLYRQIWTDEGSPLLIHTKNVTAKLQAALGNDYIVEFAMRYQNPDIKSALEKLRKEKPSKIIILPLYPQYASSSTGSTLEKLFNELKEWEVIPSLNIISKFYDDENYINAFVEEGKKFNIGEFDHVLFSYHGLPERHIKKGSAHYGSDYCQLSDKCCSTINRSNQYCYRASCFYTTREIAKKLNIPVEKYTVSFQSRLNDKWIKPYSDEVIKEKAKQGIKRMLVFSPAFVADCLETIYEIGTEYNEIFREHGGEKIELVKSLNDNEAWVETLKKMILKQA
ncbi:MAG: ferrochelatase [Bacteroidia bacterium]